MPKETQNPFIGTPFQDVKGVCKIEFDGEVFEAECFNSSYCHVNVFEDGVILCVIAQNEDNQWICHNWFGKTEMLAQIDINKITIL